MADVQQTRPADSASSDVEGATDDKAEATSVSDSSPANTGENQTEGKTELDVLSTIMGREFTSLDEASEHYKNLKGLVGDETLAEQRKSAHILDSLAAKIAEENGWSKDVAVEYLKSLEGSATVRKMDSSGSFDPQKAAIDSKLSRMERDLFLAQTPDASQYIDRVEEYVKATNKSYKESYEFLYAPILKTAKELAQTEALRIEKKGAQVAASSSTPVQPEHDKEKELLAQYQKTGKSEYMRAAMQERWNKNPGLQRAAS